MAANSKAELIVQDVVSTLENVSTLTTVARTPPYFNKLNQIDLSDLNLPYVAVESNLPRPVPKRSNRGPNVTDIYESTLNIIITVYANATANPDQQLLSLADDVWVALLEKQDRGGNALYTDIDPEMTRDLVHPHIAFNMTAIVTYNHTISSI